MENQILLNCFTRRCKWAHFVIRVDNCVTFGVKQYSTRSIQFPPKLLIDEQLVTPVQNGESSKCPGRYNEIHIMFNHINPAADQQLHENES